MVSQPSNFSEVVTEWQRRLLQLDRRNNLLYFKPGRTAVLVADHTAESITAGLHSAGRRGLTFDYAEPRPPRSGDPFYPAPTGPVAPYVVPGDLRSDGTAMELQRRLGNLRRRTKEWQDEQGLNVLFLALGFLQWIDQDGVPAAAPLLFLPCRLERSSPREPFKLFLSDDEDIDTNPTLGVRLAEFGFQLPEFDTEEGSLSSYFGSIRSMVKQRPEWSVKEEAYLSTFAYSKLAMWRDLETIKKQGTDNAIVLTLAGALAQAKEREPSSSAATAIPQDLSGGKLDDLLDVREQFAVLPADYSQLLAITAARREVNLVIHGPPGTGKSQTIANIIATLMAEGKSVLFVSEKTAALDVVKHRLDDQQLGAFCLDLHSERGSKASIYQQLRESVDDQRLIRRLEFDYAGLAERRQQLNQVVRSLHERKEPLGSTVFQVQGRFAALVDAPHVAFPIADVKSLAPPRLAVILALV